MLPHFTDIFNSLSPSNKSSNLLFLYSRFFIPSRKMAKKQKQQSFKRSNDLPTPPWIQIINTLDTSNVYAEALCSLIPHSHVHDSSETLSSLFHSDCKTVSIWTKFSISANRAANMARDCQNAAMKRGCNMASITLCNDSTFKDFMAVAEKDWPANHVNIQVDGTPADEVGKQILRWLCKFGRSSFPLCSLGSSRPHTNPILPHLRSDANKVLQSPSSPFVKPSI